MIHKPTSQQIEALFKQIKDQGIIDVDFRFTDPRGIWHHMTFHIDGLTNDIFENGIAFDGSSIAGWKPIHDSDMSMIPDLSRIVTDPFAKNSTLIIFCDIVDPSTQKGYERDPRTVARKAEAYLVESGLGTDAYFGPEPEFFVFDRVNYDVNETYAFYNLHSEESASPTNPFFNNDDLLTDGLSHRPNKGAGYAPVAPVDRLGDLRSDMLLVLKELGMGVIKHHHEVASAQHELGFDYSTLLTTADNLQLFKYGILNVCHQHDKTATFMAKPISGDNGSGMHVHQSIWKGDTPLFLGDRYNDLSQMALHYIGGILKHARALNAFTNPTTNSYKRLIPGYEAPVYRAYSARNRSAAIRIPYSANTKAKRIEVRFPDPTANPYLCLSAMLMAGLDGIKNKIDPGEALEENLYEKDISQLDGDFLMSSNLHQAMESLKEDSDFLTQGNVFTKDQINSYMQLKRQEIDYVSQCPSPAEFKLYYSS
ncbi:MAG TPA: type I glutamate--ammonia ligase [Holosporales bacterium]|nr:type I glutamate--ammonia ligase [Holosporales bacterium]